MSRDLIFVAIALFTWGIGEGSFFIFQPLYLEKLGASPIAIGSILGAVGIAMAVTHIPAGHLADRFGRRKMLWAAWLTGLTATWVMALARTLPAFVAGLMLYALTAFVISPLNSYVTAARGKWSVGRALTLISAAYNAGAVLGPLVGGFIGNHFGLEKTYLFAACIFILSNLFIYNLRAQPVEPRGQSKGDGLHHNRAYLAYLAVIFLAMFAMYLPQPLTPNFLQNVRGLSLDNIGAVGAAGSLGNVVLSLSLGRLSALRGFLLGQVSVSLFALLLWQGAGMPWYLTGYFLLGGYRAARSLATAQVRELVELKNIGLAYGITEAVSAAAMILVPPLSGYLYSWNPETVFPLTIILIIISLLVSARFSPRSSFPNP